MLLPQAMPLSYPAIFLRSKIRFVFKTAYKICARNKSEGYLSPMLSLSQLRNIN